MLKALLRQLLASLALPTVLCTLVSSPHERGLILDEASFRGKHAAFQFLRPRDMLNNSLKRFPGVKVLQSCVTETRRGGGSVRHVNDMGGPVPLDPGPFERQHHEPDAIYMA